MKNSEKYYHLKSELEGKIQEFIEICIEIDRDWHEELNDFLLDGPRNAGIKERAHLY